VKLTFSIEECQSTYRYVEGSFKVWLITLVLIILSSLFKISLLHLPSMIIHLISLVIFSCSVGILAHRSSLISTGNIFHMGFADSKIGYLPIIFPIIGGFIAYFLIRKLGKIAGWL
jgi:hypothetical protein